PAYARHEATDILIVRSERHAVRSPRFRGFVAALGRQVRDTGVVRSANTSGAPVVSRDGHAAMVPIDVPHKGDITKVLSVVEKARAADPSFSVFITGTDTLNHDFSQLSQDDLKSGELRFGLPAALVILVLVFGAVVAGLVPVLIALLAIVSALGLT